MVDTRRACAAYRATNVAQTVPTGNGAPLRPNLPVANAAMDPAVHEQQDSSLPLSVRRECRTATPSPSPAAASCSLVRRGPIYQQPALLMAWELLCYRPTDDLYDEWLHRITELVNAAGEVPAPTHSSRPPSLMEGNMDHGVLAPPPLHG